MKTLFSRSLLSVVAFLFLNLLSAQAEDLWITDYEAALKKAKEENKLVLVDFTGSDWCGWCIKLKSEVFSTRDFERYARKNLVLLEIDFPRNKPQSPELKKQNDKLSEKFGIQGYPTIIILNASGEKVGQLGYIPGGPSAFLKELRKIK